MRKPRDSRALNINSLYFSELVTCPLEVAKRVSCWQIQIRMNDSECSSASPRPKTPEESGMPLAPPTIGRDGVLAEVPLFFATIAVKIGDFYPSSSLRVYISGD